MGVVNIGGRGIENELLGDYYLSQGWNSVIGKKWIDLGEFNEVGKVIFGDWLNLGDVRKKERKN